DGQGADAVLAGAVGLDVRLQSNQAVAGVEVGVDIDVVEPVGLDVECRGGADGGIDVDVADDAAAGAGLQSQVSRHHPGVGDGSVNRDVARFGTAGAAVDENVVAGIELAENIGSADIGAG